MSFSLQEWPIIALFTVGILLTFYLLSKYLTKYKYSPLRDLEDVKKSPERYLFYFLTLAIFMPLTEVLLEIYKVREKSEMISSLIFSILCFGIYFFALRISSLKNKLHILFAIFYSVYGFAILFQIYQHPDSLINATELSLVMAFSYYGFYRFRYFFIFNLAVLVSLFFLFLIL